jgi:uncharacterized protein YbjT (DUF2867 family)
MKVILFGATGMVGQGVLRECLLDDGVEVVLSVGRSGCGQSHPRLRELVHKDLMDLSPVADQLAGYHACLFCLGVSSSGMTEQDYRKVTFDLTLNAARLLVERNPDMVFEYISGAGTDSSEKGRSMWARVKGQTENALLQLPFKGAFMLRPGLIQPLHGIKSRTRMYRVVYGISRPLFPLIKLLASRSVLTTESLGKAMLRIARDGAPKAVLEARDLTAIAG